MIRFLLRVMGFMLLAVAFSILVVDGTRSIAAQHVSFLAFGDVGAWLGGVRFTALLQRVGDMPALVQRVMVATLTVPGWLVAGVVGLLLLQAGRRPAAMIDFSSR